MRRIFLFTLSIVLLAGLVPARGSDVLDRIIAIVNNTPVLLSDWDEAWRCEALLAGRAPDSYSKAEQQEVFSRLVDQELIREQMKGYLLSPVSAADLESRIKDVRSQLAGASDAQWKTTLQRVGITEEQLSAHLQKQIELEQFVDMRFRAGIRIDDRSISHYYRNEFLPKLQQAGGKPVPLEEVSGKIREILTQQRMEEQLNGWIQTLREQADIRIPPAIEQDRHEIVITGSK